MVSRNLFGYEGLKFQMQKIKNLLLSLFFNILYDVFVILGMCLRILGIQCMMKKHQEIDSLNQNEPYRPVSKMIIYSFF